LGLGRPFDWPILWGSGHFWAHCSSGKGTHYRGMQLRSRGYLKTHTILCKVSLSTKHHSVLLIFVFLLFGIWLLHKTRTTKTKIRIGVLHIHVQGE
jgi:hypothetical protein